MKTHNYNTPFFRSICRIESNISKYIMQLSRKNNKTKPEKEAAIHTTAVNEINRKGKSIAPLPTIKDLPHLRERNGLLLELEFLCNSSKTKFPIMPKQFQGWRHAACRRDRGARGLRALLCTEVWSCWKFHCCNLSDPLTQQLNQPSILFTSIIFNPWQSHVRQL